ncbi:MAG: aldehyde dehydrogenase family protein [Burkholderiales bacterium]|nr:aldehyde dehydrogenase family protein [Burkholderiales bacterium]
MSAQTAVTGVLIDNQWHTGEAELFGISNPVTGAPIAQVACASTAQVDAAVRAAQRALPAWRSTAPADRGALLRRMAEQVEAQRPRLEALQQLNSGKPAFEAGLDVSDVVATLAYYADLCSTGTGLLPQAVALPDGGFHATLERVPVGVVGLIVPWNFPMVTTAWKLAPALAAGCTVVLKPSELTPLAEIALLEIFASAGLPPGVVNLVYGAGAVGQALVQHPAIAKVSFTGSNATGQRILQSCGPRMQRVSLELGGKSSLLVLDDADLDQAVDLAVGGAFFNAGQMCSATSRISVARPLYADFVERFVAAAQALRHGDPQNADTTLGPIISRKQQQAVLLRIQTGVADGARLLTGGSALPGLGGFAIAPTVFSHAEHSRALWQEEVFGPVACVRAIDSDAQAVAVANDSDYGLVATIVAGDVARARQVAAGLEVGTVWINTPQLIFPQTSWGGFKHSGLGRELGPWGLQAFQELRHTVAPS